MALKSLTRLTLMATAISLSACSGFAVNPVGEHQLADNANFDPWTDKPPAYQIGEGDRLQILFPNTPELDEESLVRPDGVLFTRAGGDVQVASMSVDEASNEIATASEKRLLHPQVQIKVLNPASGQIFVGGEVKNPGIYPIVGPANVVSALQQAGGSLDTSSLKEIVLIRRSPNNRAMRKLVDVSAMLEGRGTAPMRLYQGDILFVPKSSIAEFDSFIDLYVNKALPFTRSFSYSLGRTLDGGTTVVAPTP